ncbi:MAG: LPS assembly lipoprotein LptE [Candidatus Omnitrophota bacterium]
MIRRFLLLPILAVVIAGCGYTTGSLLPSNYRTICVQPFVNKVAFVNENVRGLYVPLLETKVRTAIIDRFLLDGHLRINDSDKSDFVLKGELLSFDRDELRTDQNQNVQEYRLRITVSLSMWDNTTGKVFWQEPSFAGEATYFTSGPQAKSESEALNDALTDISRRVVERTIENW